MNKIDLLNKYKTRKPELEALRDQMMAESPNEADSILEKWTRKLTALDVTIAELEQEIIEDAKTNPLKKLLAPHKPEVEFEKREDYYPR